MANSNLKIIVERNVPFLGVLDGYADVRRLAAADITPDAVRDADALIVRTRTRCDAALLGGSAVKFIGTATIGTDHIDLPWCASQGIEAVNAPGCNAPAVAQYVFASIMQLISRPLRSYTLGIVGVGHVGSIVERWARSADMPVMLCDPLRRDAEGGDSWSSLDDIAREADIITFHTPLTSHGPYPTFHMADEAFFNSLRRAPIIINSARGPVTDTAALVNALRAGVVSHAIVDCWENEPEISPELLSLASVATPHIAGYSLEGKRRASQMVLTALCRHFGLPALRIEGPEPPAPARYITPAAALRSYNPMADTAALRANPASFETLRNTYPLRPELSEIRSD